LENTMSTENATLNSPATVAADSTSRKPRSNGNPWEKMTKKRISFTAMGDTPFGPMAQRVTVQLPSKLTKASVQDAAAEGGVKTKAQDEVAIAGLTDDATISGSASGDGAREFIGNLRPVVAE
jgi:hypothetical protein